MKLDLFLEHPEGGRVLVAWARETNLGVYMGVRFSPAVENVSYFQDGLRQLLRFPFGQDGKRRREEIPVERQPPIMAIKESELIVARAVDLSGETRMAGPKTSAGTMEIEIPREELKDCRRVHYEAYLIRDGYMNETETKGSGPALGKDRSAPVIRLFPLNCFSGRSLALLVWGE